MAAATRWRFSGAVPYRMVKRATLVNARIKWVKDRGLDAVVSRERHLRPAVDLVHAIYASATGGGGCGREGVPVHEIPSRRRLGLPATVPSTTTFMRRHPAVFHESRPSPSSSSPSSARPFRWFGLTPEAAALRREEAAVMREMEVELVNRLRKLLMLAAAGALPLPVVDQLRWDLGLPLDYRDSILPRYPQFFRIEPASSGKAGSGADDERHWLRLLFRDPRMAVSRLQMDAGGENEEGPLAFQLSFTRGFGLKKKWVAWLEEWQRLPYTSPYDHAAIAMLDPRTDAAEKRMVALFHELLHLMVGKKTERANLSNLGRPLGLPYRFSKVFGRHPGVFYLSQKLATQTVVLREGYAGAELLEKHPLVEIRESYAALMRVGREDETDGGAAEFAGEAELNDPSSSPDDDGTCGEESEECDLLRDNRG